LLDVHGFTQHVDEPTRNQSLLDLIITPAESSHPLISNIAVRSSHHLSDHCLVVCDLSVRRFKAPAVSYSFRNIREVDIAEFHKRLRTHELFTDPADTPDEYLGQLELAVKTVLDELAPVCHGKRAGGRKGARWLEPQAVEAKKLRRRLERRWKKYGSEFDRVAYRATCRRANTLINRSRNRHRYQHVVDAGNNPRSVWSAVKDLLYTNQSDSYTASTDDDSTFCSTLATFFHNKIQNIKSAILLALEGQFFDPLASDSPADKLLSKFSLVTETEVLSLLKLTQAKSSPLDFIPTSLLKLCSHTFAPVIARLANLSFQASSFPNMFKTAQVTPLLKKQGMDDNDPSSYRPISNLNTISKILERLALVRIIPHVMSSSNFNPLQSAYRKRHSTETALLRITNDILTGFDDHKSTLLVALDQSAAFDCIDHDTLIRRLEFSFGLSGNVLGWLKSYLTSRCTFVHWRQFSSSVSILNSGVPQGSVLGPLLFSLYIAPLSHVIRSFDLCHHQYADDTQIYLAVKKTESPLKLAVLEDCLQSVHSWLQHNGLQLNPSKSEMIQFNATRGRDKVDDIDVVHVSGAAIQPSSTIRSLGVTFDSKLTFNQHVANVSKACYCHIRALRHVRESLPDEVAKTVACSIVCSRLDYCNSLFAGMTKSNIQKLQRIQNTLARVILCLGKFEHITPALIQLHWLPVEHRLTYKLATLTFKTVQTGQPVYLRELLDDYEPVRTLRSSSRNLLCEHKTNLVISKRAFRHSAAVVWNNLPDNIRDPRLTIDCFKSRLKTHLFNLAFSA